MKKTVKVASLSLALACGLSFVGGHIPTTYQNVSYASESELSYKNTLTNHIQKDDEFKATEEYQKANDALKTIYQMAIDYGKELLADDTTAESEFKAAAQQIYDAKKDINNTENPLMEKAKYRVELRLEMIPANTLILSVPRADYNKEAYDKLTAAYGRALNVYEDVNASIADTILATSNLKRAARDFETTNNRNAKLLRLQQAYDLNKQQADAARNLLKNYPNTVKNVKSKLEAKLKEAERLQKEAEKALKAYK